MKLGPVTKLDNGNTSRSKKTGDVISTICNVIVLFPIYGQYAAIWKSDSRHMVCKTYIFINSHLLSYRT